MFKTVNLLPVFLGFVLFCLLQPAMAAVQVQALRSVKVIKVDESGAELRFPSGIAYDREGDEIYVTSPQKNKLVVMTADYFPYLAIGSGRGLNSISKSFIKDGLLYICLGASTVEPRAHIAVYDMAFMPVRQIFFPDFASFSPLDMVVGSNGNLYVVGMNGTGVMVLNSDGKFLHWIEPKDEVLELVEKAPILGVDIGRDGRLYFLSEAMGRVFVYSSDEKYLYKFGEKGGEPGKLSRPRGIAVDDSREQVYLVDYQRHTMSIFSMTGEYLFEVGGMGSGRGWFYYPSDLIVDGQGRIVVADTFNHRLQVFEFVNQRGYGATSQKPQVAPLAVFAPEQTEQETVGKIRIRRLKQAVQTDRPGDFLVVTGLIKQQQDAASQQLQLSRKGYPVQIEVLDKGKSGIWHQVFVGPYVDPLEAYRIAERIRGEEKLSAILKTRGLPMELILPGALVPGAVENQSEDSPAAEILLPELNVPAAEDAEIGEKIFPAVELLERKMRLPEDREHTPLKQMFKPFLAPQSAEPLVETIEAAVTLKPLPRQTAAGVETIQTAVQSVSELAVPAAAVVERGESCVQCHDDRIARVCTICHTTMRAELLEVGQ